MMLRAVVTVILLGVSIVPSTTPPVAPPAGTPVTESPSVEETFWLWELSKLRRLDPTDRIAPPDLTIDPPVTTVIDDGSSGDSVPIPGTEIGSAERP